MFFRQSQRDFGASFSEIVREHQAMVYSIAWHILRDKAVSEELAQDVFLKLIENWSSLQSRAHVTNWLRRAMTRRAIRLFAAS